MEKKVELVSDNKPDFVKQFLEKTKGMKKDEIAELVWHFANSRWSSGYSRGRYNPDFDHEDEDKDEN